MHQAQHHTLSQSIHASAHANALVTFDADAAMNGAVSFGVSSVSFTNNGWWRSWHSKSQAHDATL